MNLYDVAVVGGGPGGYTAAEIAGKSGLSVILFERNALGGVCLNFGCIPTKTYLNSAKIFLKLKHGKDFGVTAENISIDHSVVLSRKNRVVKVLTAGISARMKNAKVTVIKGTAEIIRNCDNFELFSGGESYYAKKVIAATGGIVSVPPITGLLEGLKDGNCITSKEALELVEIPSRLLVIGGGVIGLELAQYFSAAGSKVTVIESTDKVGGKISHDVSEVLIKRLTADGIDFLLNSTVTAIENNTVTIHNAAGTVLLSFDKLLLCVGRKPDLTIFNGLAIEKECRGVKVNAHMETAVSGLYAIGDVVDKFPLAHTAVRQAEVAVNDILSIPDKMNYVIPSCIYTLPEVAKVGVTKEECDQAGIDSYEIKLPLSYSGRYSAENTIKDCFIRITVDETKSFMVGCEVIGDYSSEFIVAATTFIDKKTPVSEIIHTVFPHPTVGEVIKDALFNLTQKEML